MSVDEHDLPGAAVSAAARLLAGAASAELRARERLGAAADALLKPNRPKLYDARRVAMAGLFQRLIDTIEAELRQRLVERLGDIVPQALLAELGDDHVSIAAQILRRSGLASDPEMVAVLMRRADEHRIAALLRASAVREGVAGPFDALLADEELADLAMGVLVADSRRFDRFQEPALARTDLPAELQHRLVWRVAAALRAFLIAHALPPIQADQALAAAVNATLAAYDEDETLEARAMQLARRLRGLERLDDALVVRAFACGQLALGVSALAVRAGIGFAIAWDMALEEDGSRLLLLLRAIGVERGAAADIALRLAPEDAADRIDSFEALDPAEAREAIRLWRLDPAYARAIAELAA